MTQLLTPPPLPHSTTIQPPHTHPQSARQDWACILWKDANIHELITCMKEFLARLRLQPRRMRSVPASRMVNSTMKNFLESLTLIECLKDDALRDRYVVCRSTVFRDCVRSNSIGVYSSVSNCVSGFLKLKINNGEQHQSDTTTKTHRAKPVAPIVKLPYHDLDITLRLNSLCCSSSCMGQLRVFGM